MTKISCIIVALIAQLMISTFVKAETGCAMANGNVLCNGFIPEDVTNIRIEMWESDGGLNGPDDMANEACYDGWNTPDSEGYFDVIGCGSDSLSAPDFYVKIKNFNCNGKTEVTLTPGFDRRGGIGYRRSNCRAVSFKDYYAHIGTVELSN